MERLIRCVVVIGCIVGGSALARGQAVSESALRPFVIGVMPVVAGGGPFGGGAVGGVAVDARGAIAQAEERDVAALREARRAALGGIAGDVAAPSTLRKISLGRLEALVAAHAQRNEPLPADVVCLAGLRRIEYVFAYPELGDVVLAGPAEGWTVDDAGAVVGVTTGEAVLQLVDLVAALRSTDRLLAGEIISCSIDPTPAGLQRLARLLAGGGLTPSAQLLRRLERAVGAQSITLTGVAPTSHFAQVLVAADWQMKRLGMGLVESPVEGLPSYLDLLEQHPGAAPQSAMPRWWIAYGDQPVERDDHGLGWRLGPPGIEVRTAARAMDVDGHLAAEVQSDLLAQQWADAMTAHYDELARAAPVFGQLRGCMDLALVAAVLASGDLLAHVGLGLPTLLDESRLKLAPHHVPQTVASQASALRRRRGWVVTVSGGVELDVTHAVNAATVRGEVQDARMHAAPAQAESWWWD